MISIFCCQVALAQESDKDYTERFTQAEQMAQSATKEGADKAIELWKGMLKDYPNDFGGIEQFGGDFDEREKVRRSPELFGIGIERRP